MKDVILVVEGSGNCDLDRSFRIAIDGFLEGMKARVRRAGKHWQTVPGGGRDDAYDLFLDQTKKHTDALVLLLVDSEASTSDPTWSGSRWARRPKKERRIFFMVRCMEAWIVSDQERLEQSHSGLKKGSLPKGPPESYSPEDLRKALEAATKECGFGSYEKRHCPLLLESVRDCCRALSFGQGVPRRT